LADIVIDDDDRKTHRFRPAKMQNENGVLFAFVPHWNRGVFRSCFPVDYRAV